MNWKLSMIQCMECGVHVGPNRPHDEDCSRYGRWVDYDVTDGDREFAKQLNRKGRM